MIKPDDFVRVNNDVYGNPRYVIHFLELLNDRDEQLLNPFNRYDYAIKKGNLLGGKKYHTKDFGGGIVFQSYSLPDTAKYLNKNVNKTLNELEKEKREQKRGLRNMRQRRNKF